MYSFESSERYIASIYTSTYTYITTEVTILYYCIIVVIYIFYVVYVQCPHCISDYILYYKL